jgi:diaminopropionate ammonia-lyase
VSLAAWPSNRLGVELFITIQDRYAEATMLRLARPQGGDPVIEAGESGAAGLAGLLALLESPELSEAKRFLALGPHSDVLVINTEEQPTRKAIAGWCYFPPDSQARTPCR